MAMAGLRFGYMMAHPDIAREVYKAKLPYNVNIFTLAAVEVLIENRAVLNRGIKIWFANENGFSQSFGSERGASLSVGANFILIRTAKTCA